MRPNFFYLQPWKVKVYKRFKLPPGRKNRTRNFAKEI